MKTMHVCTPPTQKIIDRNHNVKYILYDVCILYILYIFGCTKISFINYSVHITYNIYYIYDWHRSLSLYVIYISVSTKYIITKKSLQYQRNSSN